MDVYLNGVRLVYPTDYSASDGSKVGLTTNAINGDTLELVAYKAFNVGSVENASGNFTVGGNLTVDGTTTLAAGSSVSYATTAFNVSGLATGGNVTADSIVTAGIVTITNTCLLYTSPSPRDS